MSALNSLVTLVLGISIAAERMIEILKGLLPNIWLFKTNPDANQEARRCACIHVLAGGCGALIAWEGNVKAFKDIDPHSWVSCVGVGLLTSAGSAFWNPEPRTQNPASYF